MMWVAIGVGMVLIVLAFAHVGVRAATLSPQRDLMETRTHAPSIPVFKTRWFHPNELHMPTGRVYLNRHEIYSGWCNQDRWFDPDTGEYISGDFVKEAYAVTEVEDRKRAARHRARKYGARP